MARIWVFVLLLSAWPVQAQERDCLDPSSNTITRQRGACPAATGRIYKCPGKGGVAEYRSWPCDGVQAEKTWDASPPSHSQEDAARIQRQRAEADAYVLRERQRNGSVSRQTGFRPPTQSESRHARCESAKQERERILNAGNNHARIDVRQRLNAMVYDACK